MDNKYFKNIKKIVISSISISFTSCVIYIQSPELQKNETVTTQKNTTNKIDETKKITPIDILNPLKEIKKGYTTPNIKTFSGWNFDELNTGKDSNIMSDLEKDVLLVTNMLRTNPSKFSDDFVKPLLDSFENGSKIQIINGIRYETTEGKSVVEETINFLKNQSPIKPLNYKVGLRMGALDHVKDTGSTGTTGHTGSDGSSSADRMNRYGKWNVYAGENIDYGNDIGLNVVLHLLIDDGVPSRGHRENLFQEKFNYVGIGCGYHKVYKTMCVQDFAGEYL